MRKPLEKYSFLPRTVNETRQYIKLLCESLTRMEESFSCVDFESVPKRIKLPSSDTFSAIRTNLEKLSEEYTRMSNFEKEQRENGLTKFVFISEKFNQILASCPVQLLKKNDMYWMRQTDWMSIWSFWFQKEKVISKGIIQKFHPELESLLGHSQMVWKDFQKIIYKMTTPDLHVSDEDKLRWKEWKAKLVNDKKELVKKPKKDKVKKMKPKKKMVPRTQ